MSQMLALFCVGWLSFAATWSIDKPAPYALEDADIYFEHFIQEFERNYSDEHEKQSRFQIFKANLEKINSYNERSPHAVYGITQFSDLSREEFETRTKCLRKSNSLGDDTDCTLLYDKDIKYNDAPESWDWREHDAVTPVKDQGQCGSCYAFSAIGNIEGQYAIKHNQLISLSEQQILDCDKRDAGCDGGNMDIVMRELIKQGGSESEDDYKYRATDNHTCLFDANKVKVKLSDCNSYNLTSQEKLKQLLYHNGPISIGLKGLGLDFYVKGIISDKDCDLGPINHGVLLVGYGSEKDVPFWIVKNSWGDWGEKGYFRMHRGDNAKSCSMMASTMQSAIVV